MAWTGSAKKTLDVGVVGLGYVGLPLALQIARSGHRVLGLDIDPDKVAAINAGKSYIRHVAAEEIAGARTTGTFSATLDFSRARELDAIIICVPTPLTKNREPDIQYIISTGRQIGPHVRAEQLIVLESTTYPGTTDSDLRGVLERLSNLKAGEDFHLAFSPEREDPGNPKYKTADIPKVVGGLTPQCGDFAMQLYTRAGLTVVKVSTARAAEATKLLENIFRSVNIAMVNELKIVFEKMGIDIWEIVNAAKTKPFGYMPFYPGPGLGGHCIPIDPFYLTWKAREYGVATRFIELAGEINTAMPRHVVTRLLEALSDRGKALKGAKVLLVGLAYKKDVDDVRESPAFALWELLHERGAEVSYHDPFVPVVPRTREHAQFAGIKSVKLTGNNLDTFDAALIVTDHTGLKYELIARHAGVTVDTRNACGRLPEWLRAEKVVKA
ncbi:MAG TPA: nucleotide sugar dehydrogenase [Planctomycetota bacterium]|nr:nucleotide sugar dehydrogenase [Planctomycetota bacterium]